MNKHKRDSNDMKDVYAQRMRGRGYRQEWQKEPYIFTRRTGEECYVVLLLERPAQPEVLDRKRQLLERYYREQGYIRVYQLCILIQPDGMFSEECLRLVNTAPNIWLYAEDQKRMFCYENQPLEFDGLSGVLDRISAAELRRPALFTGRSAPWVTLGLILVNAGCFFIPILQGQYDAWIRLGMDSRELVFGEGQIYRLFTSMFLHGSWDHLLNNMLVLAVLGMYLEPVLGHLRYTIIYLLSGIGAAVFSAVLSVGSQGSIGASGAIFGLTGALLAEVIFWRGRIPQLTPRRVAFMCIASLYGGFVTVNVDNAAHIGGLVVGFLLLIITNIVHEKYT